MAGRSGVSNSKHYTPTSDANRQCETTARNSNYYDRLGRHGAHEVEHSVRPTPTTCLSHESEYGFQSNVDPSCCVGLSFTPVGSMLRRVRLSCSVPCVVLSFVALCCAVTRVPPRARRQLQAPLPLCHNHLLTATGPLTLAITTCGPPPTARKLPDTTYPPQSVTCPLPLATATSPQTLA